MSEPGLYVAPSAAALAAGPEEPVVVLVHGAMDRSASFGRTVRLLHDLPVIRYDRRGYGRSTDLGVGDMERHVTDLEKVIDGRPTVLVGHSLGGVIALMAAQWQPTAVVSVAAWEAPMPWADWWPSFSAGRAALAGSGKRPLDGDGAADMTDGAAGDAAERFMRRMIGDDRWRRLPPGTRAARRNEGRALVADVGSLHRRTAPYDASALTQPVLAGYGGLSVPYHQRAARELAAAAGDGELMEIEDATHGAHLSHPGEFAAFVRRALERAGTGQPVGSRP